MNKYNIIEFTNQEEYKKEFLDLPKRLYKKKEIMQNEDEERQILEEKHILSSYFEIHRFLTLDTNNKAVARAIVTFYKNDDSAYIGFFECVEDYELSKLFLKKIEDFIKRNGYKNIIGPLNCSFWIGYRFKVDNFGKPYFGEPYNKSYYPKMFEESGYKAFENYTSNIYNKVSKSQQNIKFSSRLKKMEKMGYEFIEPTIDTFDVQLRHICRMILNIYSKFPAYKPINEEDFFEMYRDLKKIVDCSMIKLAYYKGEMVGFFVAIPNYSNYINSKKYLRVIISKILKKEYILMYLGVEKEHLGLGRALAESMKEQLKSNRATSIGALIKSGNANKVYFKELIAKEYHYVLYNKSLEI